MLNELVFQFNFCNRILREREGEKIIAFWQLFAIIALDNLLLI